MFSASPSLIFNAMGSGNVLPITSRCNLSCVFCSHKQNPPDVKAYGLPERDPQEIIDSFQYLSENKKIIIGESATGMVEGEPLCYTGIKEVLGKLRQRFPETMIQITTNGILLNSDLLVFLKELEPLELIISLNTLEKRKEVLGDLSGRDMEEVLREVKKVGLNFHGSVVALPHILGWESLRKTLWCLEERGADTIRVFLPGFTRLAPPSLIFEPSLWKKLHGFLSEVRKVATVPIILEPPLLTDLEARIEGVIKNSPAWEAGLQVADVIGKIDGQKVICREDAFNRVKSLPVPVLSIYRNGQTLSVNLRKKEEESPGFVMYSDVDPGQAKNLLRRLKGLRGREVLILTSVLGYPLIKMVLKNNWQEENKLEVKPVPNEFFGGSIMSAGLLVVEDFIKEINNLKTKPEVIILPQKPFDLWGKDLLGIPLLSISEKTGFPVITV
ncbi:MAG: DUF512 domain-containing protein [Candidatus Contubernalis sp.]|nr:DUF512 domain-containing protein [Candidatus Contubernalis sp.]